MKDLSRLFALLMIAGATLTFTACSDDDADVDPEPEDPTVAALLGDWKLQSAAGALAVGPGVASSEWWSNSADDVATRACLFDDVWTFGEEGVFTYSQDGETWLETWQGVEAEACGAPVAVHDGSGDYTFGATETSITLSGSGAFLGLAKAYNGGELNADNTTPPATRNYTILELTASTLKLDMPIGGDGHWTFTFTKQ